MTLREFEDLVAQALDDIPEVFAKKLDNVGVVVEIWPTRQDLVDTGTPSGVTLFGLYRGVPQTKRANYAGALPDKIIIFAGPLVAAFGHDPDVLRQQVRNTVLHELGHHFGMTDEEIRRAGK